MSINLLLSAIATQAPAAHSYALAGAMFAGLLLGSVAECQYWQRTMRAGFQLRAVLIAEVYRCACPARLPVFAAWESFMMCPLHHGPLLIA